MLETELLKVRRLEKSIMSMHVNNLTANYIIAINVKIFSHIYIFGHLFRHMVYDMNMHIKNSSKHNQYSYFVGISVSTRDLHLMKVCPVWTPGL